MWSFAPATEACGDKFLVIGRGIRRIPLAAHPTSILLYMRPHSRLPAADRELRLEASLKQAGHRVESVEDAPHLEQMLATGRFGVVLADLADAQQLGARAGRSRPVIVPVGYRSTAAELTTGRDHFGHIVKAPDRGFAFLAVIDDAAKGVRP